MISRSFAIIVAVLSLAACDNEGDTQSFGQSVLLDQLGITSITIAPQNTVTESPAGSVYLSINDTEPLIATGHTVNGTSVVISDKVTWSSSSSIATVNSSGLLTTGANAGVATITAKLSTLVGTQDINVSAATAPAIAFRQNGSAISTPPLSVDVCRNVQLDAVATYSDSIRLVTNKAVWSVSVGDQANIRVSNAVGSKGLLGTSQATAAASYQITASLSGTASGNLSINASGGPSTIQVSPATATLAVDTTQDLLAKGVFAGVTEDITQNVSWNSAQPSIATVSSTGMVTGISGGDSNITASCGGVTSVPAVMTVDGETQLVYVEIDRSNIATHYLSLSLNATYQLDLIAHYRNDTTDNTVGVDADSTWVVQTLPTQAEVIRIDNNTGPTKGTITAIAAGIAEVVVTRGTKSDSIVVVVQ
ncbi:MAG: Ig-like domain-containing protein [Gammaproteobacteria bacterium]|nr:Ig-like domain-containing protein [Gammaproteobacteria bacterium]MDH5801363.1 Ig-like domain-containing protein [Gammaproteobacteria bacterium]